MESIRIKKWVKKNSIFECQLGGRGGGGPAELVKSQLFDFFFKPFPYDFSMKSVMCYLE